MASLPYFKPTDTDLRVMKSFNKVQRTKEAYRAYDNTRPMIPIVVNSEIFALCPDTGETYNIPQEHFNDRSTT